MRQRPKGRFLFLIPLFVVAWWGLRTFAAEDERRDLALLLAQALGEEIANLVLTSGEVSEAFVDVIAEAPGPEKVIAASLPPDRGWIVVVAAAGDGPGEAAGKAPKLFVSEEMSRISRFDPLQAVADPSHELRVIEEYDARTGALSFVRQLRILKWNGKQLRSVWEGRIWEESYSPEPPFARKVTLETRVDIHEDLIETVEIGCEYERRSDSVQYDPVTETRNTRSFRWDARTFRFVSAG